MRRWPVRTISPAPRWFRARSFRVDLATCRRITKGRGFPSTQRKPQGAARRRDWLRRAWRFCVRERENPHQQRDDRQRRRIDNYLHSRGLVHITDQGMQCAPQETAVAQNPGRIPYGLVERGQDVGLLEEGDGL